MVRISKNLPKNNRIQNQVLDYLERRLLLEAKTAVGKKNVEINQERGRLAKNKAVLLETLETNFDALLNFIEDSRESETKTRVIEKIWPERVLKTLNVQQQKRLQKGQSNWEYFEDKIKDEFDEIILRIFSVKRMEQLVNILFRIINVQNLETKDKNYRILVANTLLRKASEELENYLPIEYSHHLRDTFEKVRELASIIEQSNVKVKLTA